MRSKLFGGINILYYFPVVIIIFTFTLLYAWIPPLKNMVLLYLGLVVGIIASRRYYQRPMMIAFLIYVIVLFLNLYTGDSWISSNNVFSKEITNLLLTGLMSYAIITSKDSKLIKFTVVSFILMLIVNAIGTAIVETIVPGSIRTLEQMRHQGDEHTILLYFRFGMANYALPSALVSVIPMFVLGVKINKNSKQKRLLLIAGLVASLMLTYFSGSTTAFILGILGTIVGVFVTPKTGRRQLASLAVLGLVFAFILSNDQLMLSSLNTFDGWVGNEGYFHNKVSDFEELIMYGEATGSVEGRQDLYMETWNAIKQNPFLGVNSPTGGHSLLLDHWGCLGLVGFIPFLIFVFSQIKLSSILIPSTTKTYYFICVFITFLMMAIKNMNGWETWMCLFTILPALCVYIEDRPQ